MSITARGAPTTLASQIADRRRSAGMPRLHLLTEVAFRIPRSVLSVSPTTLRRYETGAVSEARADPVLVAALAEVFGCTVQELSPTAAAAIGECRRLFDRADTLSEVQRQIGARRQQRSEAVPSKVRWLHLVGATQHEPGPA